MLQKNTGNLKFPVFSYAEKLSFQTVCGGEGGSRTLARVTPPKALAKPPLRPLGYFSVFFLYTQSLCFVIVFGGEKGVRTLDRLSSVPVFKTGAINQLDHLSVFDRHVPCYSTMTRPVLSITFRSMHARPDFMVFIHQLSGCRHQAGRAVAGFGCQKTRSATRQGNHKYG